MREHIITSNNCLKKSKNGPNNRLKIPGNSNRLQSKENDALTRSLLHQKL